VERRLSNQSDDAAPIPPQHRTYSYQGTLLLPLFPKLRNIFFSQSAESTPLSCSALSGDDLEMVLVLFSIIVDKLLDMAQCFTLTLLELSQEEASPANRPKVGSLN
jgi:hypothetical protein